MKCPVYSGAPLLWTPWGPGEVSCIERCPHFRCKFTAYSGLRKVSLLQRCPCFMGSFKGGSTACTTAQRAGTIMIYMY